MPTSCQHSHNSNSNPRSNKFKPTLASLVSLNTSVLLALHSVFSDSLAFTLSHLSSAALALASLVCLLCPRFRVGSQSGLFSSSREAGFPERKCLEHILSLAIILSVRSTLLIADKKPVRRFRLSFSRSLPLLVITLGILWNDTSLSRPDRLEQPKTTQSTIAKYTGLYTTTRDHVTMKTLYSRRYLRQDNCFHAKTLSFAILTCYVRQNARFHVGWKASLRYR